MIGKPVLTRWSGVALSALCAATILSCTDDVPARATPRLFVTPMTSTTRVLSQTPTLPADPSAILAARAALAQQLRVDPLSVTVIRAQRVDWPDACLGVKQEGQVCAQVITPGYRVALECGGKQYEVHTDLRGQRVALSPGAAPEADKKP